MIDFEKAKATALAAASVAMSRTVVILDEKTLERDFGWVFFYQSEKFVVERVASARLYGAAPVIVNRNTGRATLTGTAFPIEDYIDAYKALGADRFEAGDWRIFLKSRVDVLD